MKEFKFPHTSISEIYDKLLKEMKEDFHNKLEVGYPTNSFETYFSYFFQNRERLVRSVDSMFVPSGNNLFTIVNKDYWKEVFELNGFEVNDKSYVGVLELENNYEIEVVITRSYERVNNIDMFLYLRNPNESSLLIDEVEVFSSDNIEDIENAFKNISDGFTYLQERAKFHSLMKLGDSND